MFHSNFFYQCDTDSSDRFSIFLYFNILLELDIILSSS